MSLLIEGMNMPKNGRVTIDLASEETGTNIIARITDDKTGKLIEHKGVVVIPTPHGRLIDADAHIQSLKENQCGERCRKNHDCVNCGIGMYIRIVENEPTIIEAEGNT